MPGTEAQADGEALRQRVAERAYALWEQEGCPHGRDVNHWLKAEVEITAGTGNNPADAAVPTASRGKKLEKAAA
jgi:hypothetical protein